MLSRRARYLKNLYDKNIISEASLDNAVTKGWITEVEKNEILSS